MSRYATDILIQALLAMSGLLIWLATAYLAWRTTIAKGIKTSAPERWLPRLAFATPALLIGTAALVRNFGGEPHSTALWSYAILPLLVFLFLSMPWAALLLAKKVSGSPR